MNSLKLTVAQLAERCRDETRKFQNRLTSDTRYCFELFRAALEALQPDAFTELYQVYHQRVRAWVTHHPAFIHSHEDPEIFVQEAFSSFYFALRGERFARFADLKAVLRYFRLCAESAVLEYTRRIRPPLIDGDDQDIEIADTADALNKHIHALEVWERIRQLLPNERQQRLAYYAFVLWLKPSEIAELYPDEWPSARDVTVALYAVRVTLRQDTALYELIASA